MPQLAEFVAYLKELPSQVCACALASLRPLATSL